MRNHLQQPLSDADRDESNYSIGPSDTAQNPWRAIFGNGFLVIASQGEERHGQVLVTELSDLSLSDLAKRRREYNLGRM